MTKSNITSRRDLSFTATSDAPGIVSNWNVPHDLNSYCGDTEPIGPVSYTHLTLPTSDLV